MPKKQRPKEQGAELWERMEGENIRNYERFCAYRDMRYKPPRTGEDGRIPDGALPEPEIGKERSIRALARKLGIKRQSLEVISSKFRWVERCEAYDLYILRRMREKGEAEIMKMHETHALLAAQMIKKAFGRLLTLQDKDISAADLVRLVDVGVKIERLSRGESTERQEIGGEAKIQHSHTGAISVAQTNSIDLSSLSDEELGNLEQLLSKLHPEPGV